MFGRIWSDTVSRVKTTAVEVQQQMTQKAAKAREAFGISKTQLSATGLEQYLNVQAVQLNSIVLLEETCRRWIREIKLSNSLRPIRYLDDKGYHESISIDSSSTNAGGTATNSVAESAGETSSTSRPAASTASANKATDEYNNPQQQQQQQSGGELDSSSQSAGGAANNLNGPVSYQTQKQSSLDKTSTSATAPITTQTAAAPRSKTADDGLENNSYNSGITFKQIFLRSLALERLLLNVFRSESLYKEFAGPLDPDSHNYSVREALLSLFNLCLRGDPQLHREILLLLMRIGPTSHNHIEWISSLVNYIKCDWRDEYLSDNRAYLHGKMNELQRLIANKPPPSTVKVPENIVEDPWDIQLGPHNCRVFASRELIQLSHKLEANFAASADRKRHQLRFASARIKALTEKIDAKMLKVAKRAEKATKTQETLRHECDNDVAASQHAIDEKLLEYHSFDDEMRVLEEKQRALIIELEEITGKIDEINKSRRVHTHELERIKSMSNGTQNKFKETIENLKSEVRLFENQKSEAASITSLSLQIREDMFKTIPLHARQMSDASNTTSDTVVDLLVEHLKYEKARLLYQQDVIRRINDMLLKAQQLPTAQRPHADRNVDGSSYKVESYADAAISHLRSTIARAVDQLDWVWDDFKRFVKGCEKIMVSTGGVAEKSERKEGGKATADKNGEGYGGVETNKGQMEQTDFKAILDELERIYMTTRQIGAAWIVSPKHEQNATETSKEVEALAQALDNESFALMREFQNSEFEPMLDDGNFGDEYPNLSEEDEEEMRQIEREFRKDINA